MLIKMFIITLLNCNFSFKRLKNIISYNLPTIAYAFSYIDAPKYKLVDSNFQKTEKISIFYETECMAVIQVHSLFLTSLLLSFLCHPEGDEPLHQLPKMDEFKKLTDSLSICLSSLYTFS